MCDSVTNIQMGSAQADQKYGGQKNPIEMSRQSFFETPMPDSSQQPKDHQNNNDINVSKFENTIN